MVAMRLGSLPPPHNRFGQNFPETFLGCPPPASTAAEGRHRCSEKLPGPPRGAPRPVWAFGTRVEAPATAPRRRTKARVSGAVLGRGLRSTWPSGSVGGPPVVNAGPGRGKGQLPCPSTPRRPAGKRGLEPRPTPSPDPGRSDPESTVPARGCAGPRRGRLSPPEGLV